MGELSSELEPSPDLPPLSLRLRMQSRGAHEYLSGGMYL